MGAKISWSKATRLIAGMVPEAFVAGNVLDKNPNHLYCSGAMRKP